jgi:hypothetical protein
MERVAGQLGGHNIEHLQHWYYECAQFREALCGPAEQHSLCHCSQVELIRRELQSATREGLSRGNGVEKVVRRVYLQLLSLGERDQLGRASV